MKALGWQEWAAEFRARRERAVRRPCAPAMVLALKAAPIYRFSQRWEAWSWRLAPRIHLALASILQTANWTNGSTTTVRHEHVAIDARRKSASVGGALPAPGAASFTSVFENWSRVETKRLSAMERVFARSEERRETIGNAFVARKAHELLERVSEEKRRVEEHVRRVELVEQRPAAVRAREIADEAVAAREAARAAELRPMAGARWQTAQGAAASAAVPFPNVDAITEQVVRRIDDRLLAYRERTGRV